jgi:hypothetical protein
MLAYLLAPAFRQRDADVLMSRLMSDEGVRMFADAGLDSPGATADLQGQSCAASSPSSSSSAS